MFLLYRQPIPYTTLYQLQSRWRNSHVLSWLLTKSPLGSGDRHLLPPQRKVHFHLPTPPSAEPSGCPVLLHPHRCGICEESVVILPQVAMVLLRVDLPFFMGQIFTKQSPKYGPFGSIIHIYIYIYTPPRKRGNISHQTGKGKTSTQKCWLVGDDH